MFVDLRKLRIEMARKIMTQEQLRELSGLSDYGIRKIFDGKSHPRPETIGKLAKALQVDVTEIIKTEE